LQKHQKDELSNNNFHWCGGSTLAGDTKQLFNKIQALVGDLPVALQVLNLGVAIVIIAAKAFWQQAGTAAAVKAAISEALTNHTGSFDTDEIKAQLIQIALDNQLGISAEPQTLPSGGSGSQ